MVCSREYVEISGMSDWSTDNGDKFLRIEKSGDGMRYSDETVGYGLANTDKYRYGRWVA